jgi:hypothetical protein
MLFVREFSWTLRFDSISHYDVLSPVHKKFSHIKFSKPSNPAYCFLCVSSSDSKPSSNQQNSSYSTGRRSAVLHTHTPSSSQLKCTFSVLAPLFKVMAPTSRICWHTYTLDSQGWCQYRSPYNGQGIDSNSVEKSTSWEACNSSASRDVPHILWNNVHKKLLLVHFLCQSIKNRKAEA